MKVVGEPERGKPDFRFDEGIEGRKLRASVGTPVMDDESQPDYGDTLLPKSNRTKILLY
jgi:hypothetical protein